MEDLEYMLKGPTFINLVKYIKKKRGKDGVDRVFGMVKKEHPGLFIPSDGFKTKEFYREMSFCAIMEAFDREYGKGDLREAYNFGRFDAHNLGIMGFFISFLDNPVKVIEKAPKTWRGYHNAGDIVVHELDDDHAVMELKDYYKSRTVCTEITGFFTGAGEQTKCRNIKIEHVKCTFRGDDTEEYLVTWEN